MANFSEYKVQIGDTFASIAEEHGILDPMQLRRFHNNYCALDDLIAGELRVGQLLYIPSKVDIARLNDESKFGYG